MLRWIGVVSVVGGLALLASGSAAAKGPDFARICGASSCTTVRGEFAVQPLISWWYTPFSQRGAPRPAPYYAIKLRDPSGIRWVLLYVPGRHAMRIWQNRVPPYNQAFGPYWRTVPRTAMRAIARLVSKVRPYGAKRSWRP
jgi:hypothetical protein